MSAHKHVGNTPLTKKAIAFAIKKHEGQFREASGLPYIVHPIEVYTIVRKYKESVNIDVLCAAAILHDTIEDTDTTYEELVAEFGKEVADLVLEVTSDEAEKALLGKEAYLDKKITTISSYGLVIKLADMLANVGENPTEKAIKRICHHCDFLVNSSGRRLTSTHLALIDEIRRTLIILYGVAS